MSTDVVTRTTRKASRDALKAVYFVIAGLAFREALNRTFLDGNDFVGAKLLDGRHIRTSLLFVAFVPTAVRFVHGASIHIDALSEQRFKPLVDFAGFLIQGGILYLMAITLHSGTGFAELLCALLVMDSVWLVVLHATDHHRIRSTEVEWMVSNMAMVALIGAMLWHNQWTLSDLGTYAICGAALFATVFDYGLNRGFYFPDNQLPEAK